MHSPIDSSQEQSATGRCRQCVGVYQTTRISYPPYLVGLHRHRYRYYYSTDTHAHAQSTILNELRFPSFFKTFFTLILTLTGSSRSSSTG
jgi:hypothetical protein